MAFLERKQDYHSSMLASFTLAKGEYTSVSVLYLPELIKV